VLDPEACFSMSQASHVMAMALQKLFPEAQTTIGPWIERGFYYDFDLPTPLTPADLKAVKKEMIKIIKADLPFICEEVLLRTASASAKHTANATNILLMGAGAAPAPCSMSCAWSAARHMDLLFRSRRRRQSSAWRTSRTSWSWCTTSWPGTPTPRSPCTTSVSIRPHDMPHLH
jgi:hypothetical protein